MCEAVVRSQGSVVGGAALFVAAWFSAPLAGAAVQQVGTLALADTDGDGLDDALEAVLNTDPLIADTDGDGASDGFELARRTDPLLAPDVPGPSMGQLSVGLWSRAVRVSGYVRTFSFIYLPDGYPAGGLEMEIVVLQPNGSFVVLGDTYFAAPEARTHQDFLSVAGDPSALLMIVGVNVSKSVIDAQGYMSAATVVWHGADTAPEAEDLDKDAIDGLWLQHAAGGSIVYRRPIPTPGAGSGEADAVYLPINSEDPPADWNPGEVCYQKTIAVGYETGVVITRVVVANCEAGWDGYCSPQECPATVGDEYSSVDVVWLIGG